MIKNNKGIALAYVLIVMAIMAILGLVFIQISLTETLQAAHDKSKMQAYYLAKSGVEATVAWMVDPSNLGNILIGKTSSPSSLAGSNINGTYIVTVLGDVTSPMLLVKGTGTVNGVTGTATMSVNTRGSNINPVFKDTIYAGTTITLKGNSTITGSVAAGVSISPSNAGTIDNTRNYPSITLPVDPSTKGNFPTGTTTLDIANMAGKIAVYNNFTCGNNLTINTGAANDIATLVVNELDLSKKSKLTITGNGRLWVFVKTKMILDTQASINANADPKKLIVFIGDGGSFSETSNYDFNGYIYAPKTAITLTGNGHIMGAVIAWSAEFKGTPFVNNSYGSFDDFEINDLPIINYTKGPWINN